MSKTGMPTQHTYLDFQREWGDIIRRIQRLAPHYEAITAVDVNDQQWLIRADMHLRVGARPRVFALPPKDYIPPATADAEGPPGLPAHVKMALDATGELMKRFLDDGGTFPDGNTADAPDDITDAED